MAPQNRGLTPFGREVVERLNANRVMVDLSHSGERTCLDAIAASRQPISINHTGCRALCDLPRNKTDAELRGVAEKGGFVGIYFMPFLNIIRPRARRGRRRPHRARRERLRRGPRRHRHGRVDHRRSTTSSAYRSHLAGGDRGPGQQAASGATGERADTYPFVVDLRGVDQFRKLERLLRARGLFAGADREDPRPQLPRLRARGLGSLGSRGS